MPTVVQLPPWNESATPYTIDLEASQTLLNEPFFDEYDTKQKTIAILLNAMLGTVGEEGMSVDGEQRNSSNLTPIGTSHIHPQPNASLDVRNGTEANFNTVFRADLTGRRDPVYSETLTQFKLPADILQAIADAGASITDYINDATALTDAQQNQVAAWTVELDAWFADTAARTAILAELNVPDIGVNFSQTIPDPGWEPMDSVSPDFIDAHPGLTSTPTVDVRQVAYNTNTALVDFDPGANVEYFDVRVTGTAAQLANNLILNIQHDPNTFPARVAVLRLVFPGNNPVSTIPRITLNMFSRQFGQPTGTVDANKSFYKFNFYQIPQGGDHRVFEIGTVDTFGSQISVWPFS